MAVGRVRCTGEEPQRSAAGWSEDELVSVERLDKRKPNLTPATEADHREAWVNFQTFGWSVLQAGEGCHILEREVAAGFKARVKDDRALDLAAFLHHKAK